MRRAGIFALDPFTACEAAAPVKTLKQYPRGRMPVVALSGQRRRRMAGRDGRHAPRPLRRRRGATRGRARRSGSPTGFRRCIAMRWSSNPPRKCWRTRTRYCICARQSRCATLGGAIAPRRSGRTILRSARRRRRMGARMSPQWRNRERAVAVTKPKSRTGSRFAAGSGRRQGCVRRPAQAGRAGRSIATGR